MDDPSGGVWLTDVNALMAHLRVDSLDALADLISEDTEPDASFVHESGALVLRMGNQGSTLEFPITTGDFWELVRDLEDEVVSQWSEDLSPSSSSRDLVPFGFSIWKDGEGERIVAGAYVWSDGYEWCHAGAPEEAPVGLGALATRPGRMPFPLYDDEKTVIVGGRAFVQAFLRSVVTTGLEQPTTLTMYSWPDDQFEVVGAWPSLDMVARASDLYLTPEEGTT